MPCGEHGCPATVTYGNVCSTTEETPAITCAPTFTNWCTPVKPPAPCVADPDVARERGVVGEHRVVAHHAVVRDVAVGHDPVVVATVVSPRSCAVRG